MSFRVLMELRLRLVLMRGLLLVIFVGVIFLSFKVLMMRVLRWLMSGLVM